MPLDIAFQNVRVSSEYGGVNHLQNPAYPPQAAFNDLTIFLDNTTHSVTFHPSYGRRNLTTVPLSPVSLTSGYPPIISPSITSKPYPTPTVPPSSVQASDKPEPLQDMAKRINALTATVVDFLFI